LTGGEAVPAGEAGRVGDVIDEGGGDDRADAEDLGDRGARCPDRHDETLLGVAYLGIDAAQVIEEVGGELAAVDPHGSGRLDLLQDMSCLSCDYLFAMPPGISSQSTACSRQATWVRARPRSR
jgi:hypothetical protein